jgi:hypothetical protein
MVGLVAVTALVAVAGGSVFTLSGGSRHTQLTSCILTEASS